MSSVLSWSVFTIFHNGDIQIGYSVLVEASTKKNPATICLEEITSQILTILI